MMSGRINIRPINIRPIMVIMTIWSGRKIFRPHDVPITTFAIKNDWVNCTRIQNRRYQMDASKHEWLRCLANQ